MKITNRENLPSSFVKAVQNDPYDPGTSDITITQLIDSPQIRLLTKKHYDQIESDASDRMWALFGQAVHHILEQADRGNPLSVVPEVAGLLRNAGYDVTDTSVYDLLKPIMPASTAVFDNDFSQQIVTEQRLYATCRDWKVGAKFDRIRIAPPFVMQDYKVTSIWTIIFGDRIKEWEKQLNLQAHIARLNDFKVDGLEIVAILRDWRPSESKKMADYPNGPVVVLQVPVWSAERCASFMDERVMVHQAAESMGSTCTDEERWYNGKKKTYNRCAQYCPVAAFCPQFQQEGV